MKRKIMVGIGVGLAILLLAGAAFIIPGLLSGNTAGLPGILSSLGGGSKSGEVDVSLIPAPELPQGAPDQVGSVANVQDNSIFVTPRNGGQSFEVVVTKDTRIWQDENSDVRKSVASSSGGSLHVQEVVTPISVGQIAPDDDILIWGEARGDRTIANAVLLRGLVNLKSGSSVPGEK
jgi:hypothetical protein